LFHKPIHNLLKPHIVCYWFIQTKGIPVDTKMLPDGYSDIMINLGDPYEIVAMNGKANLINDSVFVGQRTGSLILRQPGTVNMIGIRLQPGSEFLLTGKQASTFVNEIVSLQEINCDESRQLLNDLKKGGLSDKEKLSLVEKVLLAQIKNTSVHTQKVLKRAVVMIMDRRGNMQVNELLKSCGLEYKQAERLFRKHVGLTPKMFAKVNRFYFAFTKVRTLSEADWLSVLHDCGYYDQSHFIRDFSFFSGLSPKRQLLSRRTLDDFFGFANV